MRIEALRSLAIVHGVLAWLGALGLVLAVAALGFVRSKPLQPRIFVAATLGTLLSAIAFATGAMLDLGYRVHLRQRVFLASRALGWLFERKLHLSFGALVFSCLALAALFASGASPTDRLRKTALAGYIASALFSLIACIASTIVAARLRF